MNKAKLVLLGLQCMASLKTGNRKKAFGLLTKEGLGFPRRFATFGAISDVAGIFKVWNADRYSNWS